MRAQGQNGGSSQQALVFWFQEFLVSTRERVIESERIAAAQAATTPFDIS